MNEYVAHREAFATAAIRNTNVIHLNAAGAALPAPGVTRTMIEHLQLEEKIGSHWAAARVEDRLTRARARTALLLGCGDRNIAFGETAGRLWASAFASAFDRWKSRSRGRVLVARNEWPGNIINLARTLGGDGFAIEIIENDAHGRLDPEALRARIDDDVIALCIPACGTHSGVLQPLATIAGVPRPDGCLLFVDAAQAIGQISCPMTALGIDVLVAPARKWLRGPRGQAVMGVSDRALTVMELPVILDRAGIRDIASNGLAFREDARRFEAFEFSIAGRLGFATAVDHCLAEGAEAIRHAVLDRLRALHSGLSTIAGINLHERLNDGPLFVTFSIDVVEPHKVVEACKATGIAISSVGEGASVGPIPPQIARCRVAPHAYNTSDEIFRLVEVVEDIVKRRRASSHRVETIGAIRRTGA